MHVTCHLSCLQQSRARRQVTSPSDQEGNSVLNVESREIILFLSRRTLVGILEITVHFKFSFGRTGNGMHSCLLLISLTSASVFSTSVILAY